MDTRVESGQLLQESKDTKNNILDATEIFRFSRDECFHPNLMLNYKYDKIVLVCMAILAVEFFPLGLCALLALESTKSYKCTYCGFMKKGNLSCFYILFGCLQIFALFFYSFLIYFLIKIAPDLVAVGKLVYDALRDIADRGSSE